MSKEVPNDCPTRLFCKRTLNPGIEMSFEPYMQALHQLASILGNPSDELTTRIAKCHSINGDNCLLSEEYLDKRRRAHYASEYSAN